MSDFLAGTTIRVVSRYLDIPPGELIGEGKARRLAEGRWVIARILRDCGWSTPRIGRVLGKRDHTTVLHMLKRYDEETAKDSALRVVRDATWGVLAQSGIIQGLPVAEAWSPNRATQFTASA